MSRRSTLGDVARSAGVSTATASKVLNGRAGFSESTRLRVERAIEELGYAPSTRERGPRPRSIVAVFDSLRAVYSLRVLEGVAEAAQAAGVELVVQMADPLREGEPGLSMDAERIRSIARSGHCGVLMVTSDIGPELARRFREQHLPLVSVDASASLQEEVPNVGSTHWRGGAQAAAHLIELGHRRIAFVGGDPANPGLRERLAGFLDVLGRAGAADPALVSEDGIGTGDEQLAAMLGGDDPPTAVLASTDGGALAAIHVARAAGLRVPEDFSVVGYDDTYSSLSPSVGLTTVHAPLHAIGRAAVETLLAMASGRTAPSSDVRLSTRLVVRATTAPQAAGIDQK